MTKRVFFLSNEYCQILPMLYHINSDSLQYNWSLGLWDYRLIDEASDIPSIISFSDFLAKFFAKILSICFFIFFITLQKVRVLSAVNPSQQPTVLLSIYKDNTWTIRRFVDETINPAISVFKALELELP